MPNGSFPQEDTPSGSSRLPGVVFSYMIQRQFREYWNSRDFVESRPLQEKLDPEVPEFIPWSWKRNLDDPDCLMLDPCRLGPVSAAL